MAAARRVTAPRLMARLRTAIRPTRFGRTRAIATHRPTVVDIAPTVIHRITAAPDRTAIRRITVATVALRLTAPTAIRLTVEAGTSA
jgi:hypothetical protein